MSRRDLLVGSRACAFDDNDVRRPISFDDNRSRLPLRSLLSLKLITDQGTYAKANRAADQSASARPINSASNSRPRRSASDGANACRLLSGR